MVQCYTCICHMLGLRMLLVLQLHSRRHESFHVILHITVRQAVWQLARVHVDPFN